MGFRERPEYQDWRDAVFRLFGEKCIRCGHAGNIHAHHVMPVNEYPELVFEPTNGVPLCGNCHTEIKGNELAHVDDLKRSQRAILGGEAAGVASDRPSESTLRERAYAEPSNAEAVQAWFEVADAQALADFYDQHREDSTQTAWLCGFVASRLNAMGRWQDVIAVADKAMEIAEREGTLEESVGRIGCVKSDALHELGRGPEALTFLREMVGRFPEIDSLHHSLSVASHDEQERAGQHTALDGHQYAAEARGALEEAVRHILKALELAPANYRHLSWARFMLRLTGDSAGALRLAKRGLAVASTDKEKASALWGIAHVYIDNGLYADARGFLRHALQIDDCDVKLMADLAFCYYAEGNEREALRMVRRGWMLDPHDQGCRNVFVLLGQPDG